MPDNETQPSCADTQRPATREGSCAALEGKANELIRERCHPKAFSLGNAESPRECRAAQVTYPNLQPHFEIRWGDGPDDAMETEDFEVLCIRASNPYSNVTFKDVTIIHIELSFDSPTDPTIPTLPNGVPALMVRPDAMICFGDLAPCSGSPNASSICREVVLKASNAMRGKYRLRVTSCFTIEIRNRPAHQDFTLELVDS